MKAETSSRNQERNKQTIATNNKQTNIQTLEIEQTNYITHEAHNSLHLFSHFVAYPHSWKYFFTSGELWQKVGKCLGWWSQVSNQHLIQYLKPLSFARCGHIGTLSNEKAFGNNFLAQVVCVKREGFTFMNLWCVSFFRHKAVQDIVWTLNSCWSKSEIVAWSGSQEHTNVGFKDI